MDKLETIIPYMWMTPKESDIKAKITGIIPAGSDFSHPYTRYKVEFEGGEQIVLKDTVLKFLFKDLNILGTYTETFDETNKRLNQEKPKKEIVSDERDILIEKAKSLGVKSPHLIKDLDKLKLKIEQAENAE